MSLQRSLIAHDHRPILDRLPSRIRFATGTTRFKGRFSELIVALIKLAALQVRLGTIATEAAWTFHSKVIQSVGAGDRPMQSAITEEKSMRLRVPLS
jgi:hypothetical protein